MKDKVITISFIGILFLFSILHILFVDQDISHVERRKLSTFPDIVLNSDYFSKIEKYLLDHFPYRDKFRELKAVFNYKVLNRYENNQIYLKDDYIFKSNYPTNTSSVTNFISKTKKIEAFLTEENKSYIVIIPDKNFYLDDINFLHIDYDYIYKQVEDLDSSLIDIRDIMVLDDYYETDTHWKQEKLLKVVDKLDQSMRFNHTNMSYDEKVYDRFYGVYYGESAMKRLPEKLIYLTNNTISNVQVNYYENKDLKTVYNLEKLFGIDSYEVYLDGASSFIEIYNPLNNSSKELVVFRDSFGSSLVPLLIGNYSKITVIDNRYIDSKHFLEMIDFTNQDILFLYSTLLVNSSSTLKG